MSLFYGVALICLGAVVAGVTLVGARHPHPSKFFDGFVYISLFVIAVISLLLLGINYVFSYFIFISNESVDLASIFLSLAAIVGTIFYLKPTQRKLNSHKVMKPV
jgi:hypothetical protein